MFKSLRLLLLTCALFTFLWMNTAFAGLQIELVSPVNSSVHPGCLNMLLKANPTTDGEEISDVYFYRNKNSVIRRVREEPWEFVWQNVKPGFYPIYAKVRGVDGSEAYSDTSWVLVGDVQKGDIIINGGFDCDNKISPWQTNSNGTASYSLNIYNDGYFDDATYLACEINNGSDTDWHIQLTQPTGIDSGHTYQIYFYADAEEEKTIAINWQQGGDPWTVYWQQGGILISQADYYGPFEFVSNATDPTAHFKFILGGNDIDIYLDSISIIDLNASAVEAKKDAPIVSGFELYPAFPNPFNMNTVIQYELSYSGNIQLDVYNMQGKRVNTLESGTQSQGMHSLTWNGLDENGMPVSSGVYVYRLSAEMHGITMQKSHKILLLK